MTTWWIFSWNVWNWFWDQGFFNESWFHWKRFSAQVECTFDKICRGFMVKRTDVFYFFFGKPFILKSSLCTCRMQLRQPCLNLSAKNPENFRKNSDIILRNFFWKLPKRFPLKRSSAHMESILDKLVKSCPINSKKFLPKSKRMINLLDLPRKTFWFKWSSEHLEFSNEKSAKTFPLKIRKIAALSKNFKLNLKFLPKPLLSLFSLEVFGADSKSLPKTFREMSTEIRH